MPRPYQQHGLYSLKRRLKVQGLAGIDRRSRAARALAAWRAELEDDLGGPEAITAQQRAVLDAVSVTKLMLDSMDRWLLEQDDGLVNRKRRSLYPVVLQRQQLADSLARHMAMLGLERRKAEAKDLSDYLAEKYGSNGTEQVAEEPQPEEGNAGATGLQDETSPAVPSDPSGGVEIAQQRQEVQATATE